MSGLLDGKVAFVTGGAGGIGRATAQALAAEGAKVAIVDLNEAAAAETAALIAQAGFEAWSGRLDVTDKNAVDKCADLILARWGRLDIGFNNAGVSLEDHGVAWDDLTRIDKTMDINYRGVLLCMSAELRHMLPVGRGSIINTSSIAGISGAAGTGYCASKHAVIGLTRAVASRHAASGVRINAVCPGVIETNMTREYLDNADGRKMLGALVPMGRFGRPEDIANAVVFLASDKASFITGHPLVVDGGLNDYRAAEAAGLWFAARVSSNQCRKAWPPVSPRSNFTFSGNRFTQALESLKCTTRSPVKKCSIFWA